MAYILLIAQQEFIKLLNIFISIHINILSRPYQEFRVKGIDHSWTINLVKKFAEY